MPTGKPGKTLESRDCFICKIAFWVEKGSRKITCDEVCGHELTALKNRGKSWVWSKNKIKEKEKTRMREANKEAEKPRQTIFVGGYDDGTFVTADEGELL